MGDPQDRQTLLAIRGAIEAGWSDDRIVDELDEDIEFVRNARKLIYAEEVREVRHRPTEEVYADYRIRMLAVADQLGDMATQIQKSEFHSFEDGEVTVKSVAKAKAAQSNMNAAVNALKAKANIIHTVAKFGQDMGVIQRAAKQNVLVGGIVVGTATNSELLQLMSTLGQEAKKLNDSYGEKSLLEMDEPEVYRGEAQVIELVAEDAVEVKSRRPERRKVS